MWTGAIEGIGNVVFRDYSKGAEKSCFESAYGESDNPELSPPKKNMGRWHNFARLRKMHQPTRCDVSDRPALTGNLCPAFLPPKVRMTLADRVVVLEQRTIRWQI